MSKRTIITCALTGGTAAPKKHPKFPVTPQQIAEQGIEAGAAVVHIHVRDPNTDAPSREIAYYGEVVDRIRQRNSDVMIGNRNAVMVTMNLEPVIVEMATLIRKVGVKPEIEIFESGDLVRAVKLIEHEVLEGPGLFTVILAANYGLPPTTASMVFSVGALPQGCTWTAMGVGPYQLSMVAQSWLLGGHIRVGLEDNLYLSKGQFAPSNASLVTRVRQIVEPMGAEIAAATEARSILGLTAR
jgi:uncharacterized protein (DUF849 family)